MSNSQCQSGLSSDEALTVWKQCNSNALELGPRKNLYVFLFRLLSRSHYIWFVFRSTHDPLVHHGHHFGWTVHSFCRIQTLLTNGLASLAVESDLETISNGYVLNTSYPTDSSDMFQKVEGVWSFLWTHEDGSQLGGPPHDVCRRWGHPSCGLGRSMSQPWQLVTRTVQKHMQSQHRHTWVDVSKCSPLNRTPASEWAMRACLLVVLLSLSPFSPCTYCI